jgi:hypothetical protein
MPSPLLVYLVKHASIVPNKNSIHFVTKAPLTARLPDTSPPIQYNQTGL